MNIQLRFNTSTLFNKESAKGNIKKGFPNVKGFQNEHG